MNSLILTLAGEVPIVMRSVNKNLYSPPQFRYDRYMKAFLSTFLICGFLCNSALAASVTVEEMRFANFLNEFRSSLGLSTVQIHSALQDSSRSHSEWMSQYELLEHYGPYTNTTFVDRIEEAGFTPYTTLAENIACGYADAWNTFKQWVTSPSHLQNILNPRFQYIGIARAGNADQNCPFYWTNDFGSKIYARGPFPNLTTAQVQAAFDQMIKKYQ